MIVKGVTCANEKNKKVIKLSVEFKKKEEDPLHPKNGGIYTVRYSNWKLVQIGDLNQFFSPSHHDNKNEKPRNKYQSISEVGEQSDDDSQIKEIRMSIIWRSIYSKGLVNETVWFHHGTSSEKLIPCL